MFLSILETVESHLTTLKMKQTSMLPLAVRRFELVVLKLTEAKHS